MIQQLYFHKDNDEWRFSVFKNASEKDRRFLIEYSDDEDWTSTYDTFQRCKYVGEDSWEIAEELDNWVPSLKVECLEAPFPWTDGQTQDRTLYFMSRRSRHNIVFFTPWYEAEKTTEEIEQQWEGEPEDITNCDLYDILSDGLQQTFRDFQGCIGD